MAQNHRLRMAKNSLKCAVQGPSSEVIPLMLRGFSGTIGTSKLENSFLPATVSELVSAAWVTEDFYQVEGRIGGHIRRLVQCRYGNHGNYLRFA